MCASRCRYSGNSGLRNLQASTRPITEVHGPFFHEGTSKHEDLFESYVSVFMILRPGDNIGPMVKIKKTDL